jgi:predicted transcriptional regulator of viral defense system
VKLPAIEALARLQRLRKPVFTTAEASLHLGLSRSAASHALARLARARLLLPLRRGLWSLDLEIDPLLLPEYLTAPSPAYVSLQTALQLHGLITQIPRVVFVASLATTRTIRTRVADFSVHRLGPSFFGGFETTAKGVRLATAEKALLDTLYLAPGRSRLFAALPEIEIPGRFDRAEARRWVKKIRSTPRRRLVESRLATLLRREPASARRAKPPRATARERPRRRRSRPSRG